MATTRWITLESGLPPEEIAGRLQGPAIGRRRVWPRLAGSPMVVSIDPDGFALRAAGFWRRYRVQGTVAAHDAGSRISVALEPISRFGRVMGALAALVAAGGVPLVGFGVAFWDFDSPAVRFSSLVVVLAAVAWVVVCCFAEPRITDRELRGLTRSLSALIDARSAS
jgi:hypothetical protein